MKKFILCMITMIMLVGSLFAEDIVIFEPGVTPAKGGKIDFGRPEDILQGFFIIKPGGKILKQIPVRVQFNDNPILLLLESFT